MNEMYGNNRGEYDNRGYNERGYNERGSNERGYNERGYNENYNERNYAEMAYRGNNVYDMRDYDDRSYDERGYNERKRDYDRRGGKINNRDYRNYRNNREQDYYEELEMATQDIKEQARKLEDIAEMAHNQQDKTMLTKIAQKEKDNYMYLKQMMEK